MEFVAITGGTSAQAGSLANHLRAHGYQLLSPELYFMDDFGDMHVDPGQRHQAEIWCEHHAMSEIKHHHDVVVYGVYMNPALLYRAEEEGYRVSIVRLDIDSEETCRQQVNLLAAERDQAHPSWLKRVLHR